MGSSAIAVTGLGLVSPLGIGLAENWAGLCAGTSRATPDDVLADLTVNFSYPVPGFAEAELVSRQLAWRLDPYAQMALVAAREAVADAGLDPQDWNGARVAVVLGTGGPSSAAWDRTMEHIAAGRNDRVSALFLPRTLPNLAAGEISTDLQALGPSLSVSTACASGTTAIGLGRDLLRSGACDLAVVGGAESGRNRACCIGFHRMGALSTRRDNPAAASRPFDAERDGFVLGEGAGILVLEREADAVARRARIRGRVAGFGSSADAHHFTAPHPEGRGAELAINAAVADAGLAPSDISHVNAHGTSTPVGDAVEAAVLHRLFPHRPPITATKSLTGHTLGASGALEAAFTLLSLEHQLVPPIANLDRADETAAELDLVVDRARPVTGAAAISPSFGFGGQNAAVVLTVP
ncbi:beta-ketoacyl-[acyl-carrier-protein] synthase family protein [Kitasatospora sp. NPDC036755]|uniref:beta-ketoacyl-[acyl-carrier-protein] synthase family protein n=1 Tax=Kitasatospora sp. NPDC036755 TaxID=3154600 RepID=UPI0033DB8183